MEAYYAVLRGRGDLGALAEAFERAGCAIVQQRRDQLGVLLPPDHLEDDEDRTTRTELRFFLRAHTTTEDGRADVAIVDERRVTVDSTLFERLQRAARG